MSAISELADFLATQGVTTSDLIFQDWLPDAPDECLVLYGEPGSEPELGYGLAAAVQFENPVVQVVTRGAAGDSSTPEALAQSAFDQLATIQAQSLGTVPYLMVRPLQSVSGSVLGRDENQRPRYSFNVAVRKEMS